MIEIVSLIRKAHPEIIFGLKQRSKDGASGWESSLVTRARITGKDNGKGSKRPNSAVSALGIIYSPSAFKNAGSVGKRSHYREMLRGHPGAAFCAPNLIKTLVASEMTPLIDK